MYAPVDPPLHVVIDNNPSWWIPILIAAGAQFVAVTLAYWLGSIQASKAQKNQQDYGERLARRGALRTILVSQVLPLNNFLARLDTWIDRVWKAPCNASNAFWGDIRRERHELCEFARSVIRDATLLTELDESAAAYEEYCIPLGAEKDDIEPSGKRDPKKKAEVLDIRRRFEEIRSGKESRLKELISPE